MNSVMLLKPSRIGCDIYSNGRLVPSYSLY